MLDNLFRLIGALMTTILVIASGANAAPLRDGSPDAPLRVLLIPADGTAADGALADFGPLFDAVTRATGLHFEVSSAQSYSAVVEGMCAGHADIAWFGAATYLEARERGCAELLAVDVRNGESFYYAAIFAKKHGGVESVADLKGRSLALGPANSTSAFLYPVALLLRAGVDPVSDLAAIRIADSHTQSLVALDAGLVDAAGASFESFERAVRSGALDAGALRVVARSEPIPNPPLALAARLPSELKQRLRAGLGEAHAAPGVRPGMIRGYGGKPVERYDVTVTDRFMEDAAEAMALVDDGVKSAILRKAAGAK